MSLHFVGIYACLLNSVQRQFFFWCLPAAQLKLSLMQTRQVKSCTYCVDVRPKKIVIYSIYRTGALWIQIWWGKKWHLISLVAQLVHHVRLINKSNAFSIIIVTISAASLSTFIFAHLFLSHPNHHPTNIYILLSIHTHRASQPAPRIIL